MRYRRRVQVVGGSTYIVSLPKEWAKSLNLQHGTELVLEVMPDSTLKVYLSDEARPEALLEEELKFDKSSVELFFIKLIASYVVGYDKIIITCVDCSSTELEELVRQIIERTIGLEVIEKDKNIVELQCLANISTLTLSEVVKNIVRLTLKSFADLEKAVKKGEARDSREIIARDSLIDKLYLYGLRQLNQVLLGRVNYATVGLKTMAQAIYLAMMLKFLERIADHLSSLAEDTAKLIESEVGTPSKLITYVEALQAKYTQIANYLVVEHGAREEDLRFLGELVKELRVLESGVASDTIISKHGGEHLVRISAYLRDLIELLADMHELAKLVSSSA
ncbi:MAG: phosphate uptake regulator PhoU [Zestosphaera sp.]